MQGELAKILGNEIREVHRNRLHSIIKTLALRKWEPWKDFEQRNNMIRHKT